MINIFVLACAMYAAWLCFTRSNKLAVADESL